MSTSQNLKGKDHSEDLDVDGRIMETDLRELGGNVWTGNTWSRIGTGCGLL
jgi:hypothetical protein